LASSFPACTRRSITFVCSASPLVGFYVGKWASSVRFHAIDTLLPVGVWVRVLLASAVRRLVLALQLRGVGAFASVVWVSSPSSAGLACLPLLRLPRSVVPSAPPSCPGSGPMFSVSVGSRHVVMHAALVGAPSTTHAACSVLGFAPPHTVSLALCLAPLRPPPRARMIILPARQCGVACVDGVASVLHHHSASSLALFPYTSCTPCFNHACWSYGFVAVTRVTSSSPRQHTV